jgi:hypothetical protein
MIHPDPVAERLEGEPLSKYEMLVRVLDGIRAESKDTKFRSVYAVDSSNDEEIRQARSRGYIHLYLKVQFGLDDFTEREVYVTDGSQDGGIDGYYIDEQLRRIFLIQSKFRTTEENFESLFENITWDCKAF